MKKAEAKALQERYNMEIMREPVTREAWGVYTESANLIPELDELADGNGADLLPCACLREWNGGGYTYKLICPTAWFNLCGWKE